MQAAERGTVPRRERKGLLPLGGLRVRTQQEHGACRPPSVATSRGASAGLLPLGGRRVRAQQEHDDVEKGTGGEARPRARG